MTEATVTPVQIDRLRTEALRRIAALEAGVRGATATPAEIDRLLTEALRHIAAAEDAWAAYRRAQGLK